MASISAPNPTQKISTQKISLSYGQDLLAADILVCIRTPAAQKIGCEKIMLCHESKVCYDGFRVDEESCYMGHISVS